MSATIERAAEGLDANAPAWLKSALQQGAQKVQQLADTLDQNDSRQIVDQVNDFAKNSPGTFLGACAAAGFAAARIFKAGGSANTPTQLGTVSVEQPSTTNSPQSFANANSGSGNSLNGEVA